LACRFGSIQGPEVIRLLLDHGADVDRADRDGMTPLMEASELGMGSVSLLLEHGAKVDARDRQGWTPLMYALNNRGEGTVWLLLSKGADVNAHDVGGETPLMIAIRRAAHDPIRLFGEDLVAKAAEEKTRYVSLIRFLIEHGADVNVRARSGDTPLALARAARQEDVVVLLRSAGAQK
jgi:ankyrin repeat protein